MKLTSYVTNYVLHDVTREKGGSRCECVYSHTAKTKLACASTVSFRWGPSYLEQCFRILHIRSLYKIRVLDLHFIQLLYLHGIEINREFFALFHNAHSHQCRRSLTFIWTINGTSYGVCLTHRYLKSIIMCLVSELIVYTKKPVNIMS